MNKTRNPKLLAALAVAGLIGISAFWYRTTELMSPAPEWGAAPAAQASVGMVTTLERHIYPYSIVDGGVYSYAEARQAVTRDPIVAAHYSDIDMSAVRPVVLTASRRAYVSYRLGGQVFWTRNQVTIKAGEAVLTDGKQKVRARCGNKISDKAMAPVADFEDPPEVSGEGPAVTMALNTPTPNPPDPPKKSKNQDENPRVLRAARNPLQSFEPIPKEPDTAWWPPSSFPGGLIPNPPATTNQPPNPPVTPPGPVVNPPDNPNPPPPDIPGPPPVNPGTPDPPSPVLPGEPPSLPPYIPPLPPPALNENPTPPLSEPPPPIPPVQPPIGPPSKPAITGEIPPSQPPGQVVNPPGGGGGNNPPGGNGGGGNPPGGNGGNPPGGNGNGNPPGGNGGGGNPFAPVPEPSTFVVTGAILAALAYRRLATRR